MAVHVCSNSSLEETFVRCVEGFFSAGCHDCLCDAMAEEGLPCPTYYKA